jgi:hypothetical protein
MKSLFLPRGEVAAMEVGANATLEGRWVEFPIEIDPVSLAQRILSVSSFKIWILSSPQTIRYWTPTLKTFKLEESTTLPLLLAAAAAAAVSGRKSCHF